MARSKNGFTPTEGSAGIYTYYMRDGQLIMRSKENKVPKRNPTAAQAQQQSRMSNLIEAWRCTDRGLKGCFENKKPGATDYSGFLAANLPEARVFLPKDIRGARPCVADNFFVSMGTLQPPIQVEQNDGWALSDIRAGMPGISPDEWVGTLSSHIVKHNNGAFLMGDEILFVRLRQGVNINSRLPEVHCRINRLALDLNNIRTMSQQYPGPDGDEGFQVVDGRLAARQGQGELVAWIRLRRGPDGKCRATTQRLVGENPLVAKYMSEETMLEAVGSFKPRMTGSLRPEPKVSVMVASNDLALGTVQGGGDYAPGAVVRLEAVPEEGARFVIWDDGWEEPSRTFPAMQSASFKAIFVPKK